MPLFKTFSRDKKSKIDQSETPVQWRFQGSGILTKQKKRRRSNFEELSFLCISNVVSLGLWLDFNPMLVFVSGNQVPHCNSLTNI